VLGEMAATVEAGAVVAELPLIYGALMATLVELVEQAELAATASKAVSLSIISEVK